MQVDDKGSDGRRILPIRESFVEFDVDCISDVVADQLLYLPMVSLFLNKRHYSYRVFILEDRISTVPGL
jgi:hypothetical protein